MALFNPFSEQNSYEHAITGTISAMLAYWDKNLVCRYANSAYLEWFGYHHEDMVGKMTLAQLLGPLYVQNLPYINGALAGERQTFERIIPVPGGGTRYSLANYYPDVKDGEVQGFFVHVADITPSIAKKLSQQAENPELEGEVNSMLNKIVITLKEHLLTGFPGIKNLAQKFSVSETKLKKDFKQYHHTTIFAYYRHLQMELAHAYLTKAHYSKKQVAFLLAFSNPSNFSVCYKKYLKEKIQAYSTLIKPL